MDSTEHVVFKGSLQELFPPSNRATPWLFRLAVLRDDLSYELSNLGLKEDDPPEAVWRCSYSLRKLPITIGELRGIFENDVAKHIAHKDSFTPAFSAYFSDTLEALKDAAAILKPMRDSMGAHVRPESAVAAIDQKKHTASIIRAHGESQMEMVIDTTSGRATSFRGLTTAAYLFAWPDVVTDDDHRAKHLSIQAKLFPAIAHAFRAIDSLLYLFWTENNVPSETVQDAST